MTTRSFRFPAALCAVLLAAGAPAASAQELTLPPMPAFPTGALPEGGPDAAFDRLGARLSIAPGVPWSVEGDLVVPALPSYAHLFDLPPLPGIADTAAAPATGPESGAVAVSRRVPSLAAALLAAAASESGVPLDRFIQDNMAFSANITGLSTFSLSSLDTTDIGSLDLSLLGAGAGLPSGMLSSPQTLLSRLAGDGIDQRTAMGAASFARNLWGLNTPQIPSAPTPDVDVAALGFGLLTNRSLAAMASEFPDVFASASRNGLGSDESRAAWSQSMQMAFEATEPDLARALPSACLAGMLSVAASGSTGSAEAFTGCSGDCQAAGLYLNRKMQGMWNPALSSTQPTADGIYTQSELDRLPLWLGDAMRAEIPDTTDSQASTDTSSATRALTSSVSGACATADPAAGALSRTVPDLLSELSRD